MMDLSASIRTLSKKDCLSMSTWRVAGKNLVDLTREKTSAINADLLADTIQYGKDFVFDASGRDK